MLRVIWFAMAACALVCTPAAAAEEPVDCLRYAKGAANWILSISREEKGALTWPVNDTDKKADAFDLYYGMPGGILLLAELAKEDPTGPYGKVLPGCIADLERMRVRVIAGSRRKTGRCHKRRMLKPVMPRDPPESASFSSSFRARKGECRSGGDYPTIPISVPLGDGGNPSPSGEE
jgi:hypothetical protein